MNHELTQTSLWVRRWKGAIVPGGVVLDLACGTGRHARFFWAEGYRVLAADRDVAGVEDLIGKSGINVLQADLENEPWLFGESEFDGVVVTNYLYRPNLPKLMLALRPGGALIYETFAEGNEVFGRPSNPNFLLRRGELLDTVSGVANVIAYEDGYIDFPKPALVQRICAVKNGGPSRHFPLSSN